MRPAKPTSRAASAALAPARLAPTMARVLEVIMVAPGCGPGRCGRSSSRQPCEGEELGAGSGVLTKDPVERRGHGQAPRRLHPPEGHAEVLGLEHHTDALGAEP